MPFKITSAIDQKLKEIAKQLPVPDCKPRPSKYGHELIDENPSIRDRHGKELEPKKLYHFVPVPAVNHYKRMRKAFEQGGDQAVMKYLKPYLKPNHIEDAAKAA